MKKFLPRFIIMASLCFAMMLTLIIRLGNLTLAEGQTLEEEAEQRSIRTTILRGTRGRILDRNGIVLAYDETCYNVQFLRDADGRTEYYSALYTESLVRAIAIIEEGGGTVINTSYIQMDKNGKLYYDWRVTEESSKKARYKNFCAAMGFYCTDEILSDSTKWKTPESAYMDMCKSWFIPPEMPFDTAVKIISVRQEANLNNYQAYEPITFAYNVSVSVVAQLDALQDEMPGIQVAASTTRVYPQGETAAHIVGYLQRLTEEMAEQNIGYSNNDFVGASGVESTMEKYLTGSTTEHHGERVVKVNKNGKVITEISVTPPTNGNDVMLTIDLPLQKKTDEALYNIIQSIRAKEESRIEEAAESYARKLGTTLDRIMDKITLASTGAIVVLDVNTGQVLAMSSYPSFDPNWFIQGLTSEQYAFLFDSDEAIQSTPMRNKAVSAKLAPGSIFKIVTGMAGLMENEIGLYDTIDDQSAYILYDDEGNPMWSLNSAPKCWTDHPEGHQDQNITAAIKNSCNYYFYEVAHRIGIDKLNEWANKFGLNELTNIEVTGETQGMIGGQSVWFDNTKSLYEQSSFIPTLINDKLREKLVKYAQQYMPGTDLTKESPQIKDAAWKLMELQDGSVVGKGNSVRAILNEYLGIPLMIIKNWQVSELTSLLTELQWKESQTVRTGIGQESILVTPVAIARYLAAIANKGTVYDVHIVDRIQDEHGNVIEQIEPSAYYRIDAPESYWEAIHKGMEGVVSPEDRGTASSSFSEGFVNKVGLSGKTGSAQVGYTNLIDIHNTSWFMAYAPRENPEIAVVVCVPYGYSGASSASAIEEIFQYYYDRKQEAAPENLADINGITP